MKTIEVSVKKEPIKGSDSGVKKKAIRSMGTISIDESQLPEIKNWQVGEEYEFTVKVRQTEIRESDNWEKEQYGLPDKSVIARFEILSASTEKEEEEKEETNKYKK